MVRKAKIEDIDILNNFYTKMILENLKYDDSSLDITSFNYSNEIDNDNYIILIALKDKEEVGFIHSYIKNDKVIIDSIYIEKEYRNMDIGKELVKKLCDYIGPYKLEITIENGNSAYFLFNKLGFKITKVVMSLDCKEE